MKHNALTGVALMIGAMTILPFLDFCAKVLGQQGIHPFQIVWGRVFFGTFLTMPFVLQKLGPAGLKPNLPATHLVRAFLLVSATACFFASLHYLPVADTLAIFFVQPLVTTLVSPLLLGERVGWQRWLAVLIGFGGTLIIIRPGFKELNAGVFLALASGVALSFYMMLTKKVSGTAPAIVTNFYTNLFGVIIMFCALPFVWITPTAEQLLLMFAIAAIATTGHFLVIKAFDHADASLLAPLAYTEMVTAVWGGWYFFGDFPDGWTFVGVAILLSCAIFISWRERIPPPPDFEQP